MMCSTLPSCTATQSKVQCTKKQRVRRALPSALRQNHRRGEGKEKVKQLVPECCHETTSKYRIGKDAWRNKQKVVPCIRVRVGPRCEWSLPPREERCGGAWSRSLGGETNNKEQCSFFLRSLHGVGIVALAVTEWLGTMH